MEADAALAGPAPSRVLHAIAGEDLEMALVHGHRERDDERALGLLQKTVHPRVEVQGFGGAVQLRESGLEELVAGVRRAGHLQDGHEGRRLTAVTDTDTTYMRRALRLAARAAGRTSPNPLVGSVVVLNGEIVGEGYHHAAGEPHAEVNALRKAGEGARGGTLFTNLEPCAHQGRTPPCVDAIREAGVARVVVAMRDPDPRTDGKGIRGLRAAGIEVEEGVLKEDAERLNAGFVSRLKRGRPSVLLKLATTVDGRVAVPGRRYLSGKPALREVHRLRDRTDAVLVGIGTVLADDPALTVREVKGRDPLRVIVDADARTPTTAKVVRAKDPQRTVIFVARDAEVRRTNKLREAGVLLVTAPRADGGLDLGAVLRWLGEHGVNTVMSEAGPHVAGALVRGGLADRVLLLVSPVAGGDGPPALEGVPKASDLHDVRVRKLGDDLALEGALG
jgi:diaminohydroxyphosphoribosylaminopyrimidine deaminase / 5-amino-6-(5-phosphoribosylamino)uracil reductase